MKVHEKLLLFTALRISRLLHGKYWPEPGLMTFCNNTVCIQPRMPKKKFLLFQKTKHGSHSHVSVYRYITRFSNIIKVYKVSNSINTVSEKIITSLMKFSSRAKILKSTENIPVVNVRGRCNNSTVGLYGKICLSHRSCSCL